MIVDGVGGVGGEAFVLIENRWKLNDFWKRTLRRRLCPLVSPEKPDGFSKNRYIRTGIAHTRARVILSSTYLRAQPQPQPRPPRLLLFARVYDTVIVHTRVDRRYSTTLKSRIEKGVHMREINYPTPGGEPHCNIGNIRVYDDNDVITIRVIRAAKTKYERRLSTGPRKRCENRNVIINNDYYSGQ